jgi:hypothetical protein
MTQLRIRAVGPGLVLILISSVLPAAAEENGATDPSFLKSVEDALQAARAADAPDLEVHILRVALKGNPQAASELRALLPAEPRPELAALFPEPRPPETVVEEPPETLLQAAIGVEVTRSPWLIPVRNWQGDVALAAEFQTGNTEEREFDLRLDSLRKGRNWTYEFDALGETTRANDVTTEQRILGRFDASRTIANEWSLVTFTQAQQNRFSNFEWRAAVGFGVGYDIFAREGLTWSVSSGPALQIQRLDATDMTEFEPAGRLESDFVWAVMGPVTVGNEVDALFSSTTEVDVFSYLEADIISRLALRLGYLFEIDDSPGLAETVDTTATAEIVVTFGRPD